MGTYRRVHIYVRKGAFSGRIMVARVHVHLAACGMHANLCKSQRHQRGVRLVCALVTNILDVYRYLYV